MFALAVALIATSLVIVAVVGLVAHKVDTQRAYLAATLSSALVPVASFVGLLLVA